MSMVLFFIGLGTFWLSRWFEADNWRGWLGLSFLLVPATFVSVDRLTVDVALAALLVGFVFVFDRDQTPTWKLWVIVALACLVRETGILLAVACVVWLLTEKRFRSAVVFGAAALPAVAWYIYVRQHTGPFDYPSSYLPFRAMLEGLLHVEVYGPQVPFAPLIRIADTFAVLAMVAAVLLAVRWIPSGLKDPVKLTGLLFGLLFGLLSVLLQQNEIWLHVYGFGRVYTPLILLLAMDSIRSMRFIGALPWAMALPRMLITVGTQVVGIARALAS